MEVLHVSAECYPVAKVGGLGDVVGALPKYQQQAGVIAKVVMPCYRTPFLTNNEFEVVHQAGTWLGHHWFHFNVLKEKHNKLGFDLYLLDIPGLLDKEGVYGHPNDTERFLSFQIAVLDWVAAWQHQPDVIHVHDHHTALIPFMLQYCNKYELIRYTPTVLTIHNAQYQGQFGWDRLSYLPAFDLWKSGILDWNGAINPLAAGIKTCWALTTVSPSYMEELCAAANGLESLIRAERGKSVGILNGIDSKVWNPQTDPMIAKNYNQRTVVSGKKANKEILCQQFQLNANLPLVSFIGRLVGEKGADLLPDIIGRSIHEQQGGVNFLVLGSGDPNVEWALKDLHHYLSEHFNAFIGYDEALSHLIYAGSDFLLMPSRVEPCGLNQLYALRYGTVPMVRRIGGLRDTVIDFGDEGGYGICFNNVSVWDACYSVNRAVSLYQNPIQLNQLRKKMMLLDHSWDKSAQAYIGLYQSFKR